MSKENLRNQMNIEIIVIGKLKETYWRDAEAEYLKRLSAYAKISVRELKEAQLSANASEAEIRKAVSSEGADICKALKLDTYVIALDINGAQLRSEQLASRIEELSINGQSNITMVIGGSNGLSSEVLDAAKLRLSFGKFTFPHQMMRVILEEQLYRSFKIIRNEAYHK
jgi:23S rRNA (pseudouridine1915-N3)-methyltransferase